MEKKVALYIRVSTDAQYEEGYSVDAQKEMLEGYCKSKGHRRYEFYIDGGFTGSNIERPEMRRLIADVQAGRISNVVVYKLDRLSRSQKDTLYLIEDVFGPHGADFTSLNENMDTSTPMGRAMLGILSAFAQLERETIRERTRMGMKERVKEGYWPGGGRTPFGYDYDKNAGTLVPNQDAETVRRIYELYLKGYSTGRIAQLVGMKYDHLVVQILKRKSNTGVISYDGQEYAGRHQPLISRETYERTMELMEERSVRRTAASDMLLTGLVYCGKCGAKMRYQKWGKAGYKLSCYSQQTTKKYLVRDPDCDNGKPWADEVEEAVVRELLSRSVELAGGPGEQRESDPLELLRQQYDACAKKLKRLYQLYAQQEDDLLVEAIEEQQRALKGLSTQMEREERMGLIKARQQQARQRIDNLMEAWPFMTKRERQQLVRECVAKVTVTDGAVDVTYKF